MRRRLGRVPSCDASRPRRGRADALSPRPSILPVFPAIAFGTFRGTASKPDPRPHDPTCVPVRDPRSLGSSQEGRPSDATLRKGRRTGGGTLRLVAGGTTGEAWDRDPRDLEEAVLLGASARCASFPIDRPTGSRRRDAGSEADEPSGPPRSRAPGGVGIRADLGSVTPPREIPREKEGVADAQEAGSSSLPGSLPRRKDGGGGKEASDPRLASGIQPHDETDQAREPTPSLLPPQACSSREEGRGSPSNPSTPSPPSRRSDIDRRRGPCAAEDALRSPRRASARGVPASEKKGRGKVGRGTKRRARPSIRACADSARIEAMDGTRVSQEALEVAESVACCAGVRPDLSNAFGIWVGLDVEGQRLPSTDASEGDTDLEWQSNVTERVQLCEDHDSMDVKLEETRCTGLEEDTRPHEPGTEIERSPFFQPTLRLLYECISWDEAEAFACIREPGTPDITSRPCQDRDTPRSRMLDDMHHPKAKRPRNCSTFHRSGDCECTDTIHSVKEFGKSQRTFLKTEVVSCLKSWFFDHFKHPYPTMSERKMLLQKTGLSSDQLSNWFVNARGRVWKRMVEGVYLKHKSRLKYTKDKDFRLQEVLDDQKMMKRTGYLLTGLMTDADCASSIAQAVRIARNAHTPVHSPM